MPYLKIETNKQLDEVGRQELLQKASNFAASLLGKPEQYMMVSLHLDTPMSFAGSADPSAFVELKGIGLRREKCADYSKELCGFLEAEIAVPPERTYSEFWDIDGPMFGWNRRTF